MIRKACIATTVLFDDQEVEPAFFEEATLSDLERLMDDEAVGLSCLQSITPVKSQNQQRELQALGNDGTFFDLSEDEQD